MRCLGKCAGRGRNLGLFVGPFRVHHHQNGHAHGCKLGCHNIAGIGLLFDGVAQAPQKLGRLPKHTHLVIGTDTRNIGIEGERVERGHPGGIGCRRVRVIFVPRSFRPAHNRHPSSHLSVKCACTHALSNKKAARHSLCGSRERNTPLCSLRHFLLRWLVLISHLATIAI